MLDEASLSTEDLAILVASSGTWKELFLLLGHEVLPSSRRQSSIRDLVRARGIDYSHFHVQRGPRRTWNISDLEEAIKSSTSWIAVEKRLRAAGHKTSGETVRRVARESGIETHHLGSGSPTVDTSVQPFPIREPVAERLPYAGERIAYAWYHLMGYDVSDTEAHSPSDLLISSEGRADYRGVQVKTTTRDGSRSRHIGIYQRYGAGRKLIRPYSPSEVHEFFIITSNGEMYRVPRAVTGDMVSLTINDGLDPYRVGNISGMFGVDGPRGNKTGV